MHLKLPKFVPVLILILVLGLASPNVASAAGNTSLSLQPVMSNVSAGDVVTLNVSLNTGGDSVSIAELHLSYDPTFLEGQSINEASVLPILLPSKSISGGSAMIVVGAQPSSPATGTGNIATVVFKALKSGSTTVSFVDPTQTNSVGKTGSTLGSTSSATIIIGGSTATPSPVATAKPTQAPVATPASSPGKISGRVTVTFDDASGKDRVLSGEYPDRLVDWGNNLWYLSAPWQKFETKSVSFNGPAGISEASFNLLTQGHLESLQAYNGGNLPSTVTLSCAGQPTVTVTVSPMINPMTIMTGWSGNCQNITLSSSNGWHTNFDNLIIADANTQPIVTPIPSVQPSALPTGNQTINFDDLNFKNRPLNGQYPSAVIDWGMNNWFLSAPWKQFTTKSFSFNGPKIFRASFRFIQPRTLVSLKAYNGGKSSSTISLRCPGLPIKNVNIGANQMMTIETGWTTTCSLVTINSTNGWNTNFDDLVIK